jgi:hypothetical protein
MNLNTQASSADQAAVLKYVSAAERPHTLPESVFPYAFFLFRLIDALGHGVSIPNSRNIVYGATSINKQRTVYTIFASPSPKHT